MAAYGSTAYGGIVGGSASYFAAFADEAAVADSVVLAKCQLTNMSDSFTVADSRKAVSVRVLSESVVFGEEFSRSISFFVGDSGLLSDSLASVRGRAVLFADELRGVTAVRLRTIQMMAAADRWPSVLTYSQFADAETFVRGLVFESSIALAEGASSQLSRHFVDRIDLTTDLIGKSVERTALEALDIADWQTNTSLLPPLGFFDAQAISEEMQFSLERTIDDSMILEQCVRG